MSTFLNYPVNLEAEDGGGFTVTFPDVPEAITHGSDEAEALLRAVDALETALEMYVDASEALPLPSKAKRGQGTVHPTAQVSAKLAVYQAMREENMRKSELARMLGWHMPQVDRLLDIRHASKLSAVESALAALGRDLWVGIGAVKAANSKASSRNRVTGAMATGKSAHKATTRSA